MVYTLRFFLFNMQFHNSNVFGSCTIHILYTGCAKIKKNNSGTKRGPRKMILKKKTPRNFETTVKYPRNDKVSEPTETGIF